MGLVRDFKLRANVSAVKNRFRQPIFAFLVFLFYDTVALSGFEVSGVFRNLEEEAALSTVGHFCYLLVLSPR
jgi:hypothetical protein